MKKILTVLVLLVTFGINAQEKKSLSTTTKAESEREAYAYKENAKKDFTELANFIELSAEQKKYVMELFEIKYKAFSDEKTMAEHGAAVREGFGQKFLGLLDKEQHEKLRTNEELYKKLVY